MGKKLSDEDRQQLTEVFETPIEDVEDIIRKAREMLGEAVESKSVEIEDDIEVTAEEEIQEETPVEDEKALFEKIYQTFKFDELQTVLKALNERIENHEQRLINVEVSEDEKIADVFDGSKISWALEFEEKAEDEPELEELKEKVQEAQKELSETVVSEKSGDENDPMYGLLWRNLGGQ